MACNSHSAENTQLTEVSQVTAAFPKKCRVIKDMGVFTYIITISLCDGDIILKFQLTESYPFTVPEIIVLSKSLAEEEKEKLTAALGAEALASLGQPILQKLIRCAEGWLGERINSKERVHAEAVRARDKQRPPKGGVTRKTNRNDEEHADKKKALKTAEDVVRRILWDEKLNKEDFFVGYLDRFKGTVEKNFSAFSWEDIAAVDYNVLAVPKHRIQYFKYRTEKIWDKSSRMDKVFGSDCGNITIYDIVSQHLEQTDRSRTDGDVDVDSMQLRERSVSDFAEVCGSGMAASCSSANDADGSCSHGRQFVQDAQRGKKPTREDPSKPTHFLAVRITDDQIKRTVEQVQARVLQIQPLYAPCCIPAAALHMTLCTLGLDTPQQMTHAAEVLRRVKPDLVASWPHQPLRLTGVSTFFNRVLYAEVQQHSALMEFVDHLKLLLWEAGVELRDVHHGFKPHVTILKATKPLATKKGTKDLEPSLYQDFTETYFGQQTVDRVYLCAMGGSKQEDGFYECLCQI